MPLIHSVNDDFNRADSSTVGGIWSQAASTGCSNAIVSNAVHQTTPGSTTGFREAKIITTSTYDLAESHMWIKLVQMTTGLDTDHDVWFEWELGSSDHLSVYIEGGTIKRQTRTTSLGYTNTANLGTYDAGVHKYLRINHSGTTFTFQYSSDGLTWTNFASNATLTEPSEWQTNFPALTGKARIRTVANSATANQEQTTIWDDFNITPSSGGGSPTARKGPVMIVLNRPYGVATTIRVPVIKAGTDQYATSADYTWAAGDITVSKDGGTAANITDTSPTPAIANGQLAFDLTATEMTGAQIDIRIKDTDATQVIEPLHIRIETTGNASAEIVWDMKQALVTDTALVDAIWDESLTTHTTADTAGGRLDAAISSVSGATSAEVTTIVSTEISDFFNVDLRPEPTSVPAANAPLGPKVDYLFTAKRNKVTQTATQQSLFRDDGTTVLSTSSTSDDGSTLTVGKDT